MEKENKCVCCGEIIPEGMQVCRKCEQGVKNPSHYTYGKIECIDYIQDKNFNFCLGNAIKYITRAGHKHSKGMTDTEKTIQDLEKAKQYIDFEIKNIRRRKQSD